MKPASQVTAMVVDGGLFCETSIRLAQVYKKVYYCVSGAMQSQFPSINRGMIGLGMEGIELIDSIESVPRDDIDLYVFPDIGYGAIQQQLVEDGRIVWGSRLGEELELYREDTKKLMKKLGLPVGEFAVVKGVDELKAYLDAHDNQYVKIDKWRGISETFYAKDLKSVESRIRKIDEVVGEFRYTMPFVCEEALPDRVECGVDTFVMDGQYPRHVMCGIEIKDAGYAGVVKPFNAFPEPVTRWNTKIAPTLKDYGYRGQISNEVRIGKDHEPYMIDATCRQPSPPGGLMMEMTTNFPELVWSLANGVMVDIKPEAKYGVEVIIKSTQADKEWHPIEFHKDMRRYIKIKNPMKSKGQYFSIPQNVELYEIASIVGWGNSLRGAIEMAKGIADEVSGAYLNIQVASLDSAQEEAGKLTKLGLPVFG